jgi:hypothetical protein
VTGGLRKGDVVMRRLLAAVSLVAALIVGGAPARAVGQAAAAKADPWLAKTTRVSFQAQKAAGAAIQVDVPKKDWMMLPSAGSALLVLASRKGDAVVLVERSPLAMPLEAADITDLFAQLETDGIKEREPKAAEFQARVLDAGDHRLVAVQYSRPGVLGSEQVRQYSMPVGKQLYRLSCISSASQFGAYDAVFAHIAASFVVTP